MAKVNVSLPQGTRDFSPEVLRKRQYIVNTIKNVFELYGFEPLETPAMENLDTLMGKYGEEGDKLIFKILNNGLERPEKHDKARADFEKVLEGKNISSLTERALRYDLTIPFARYVAMNHGQLNFPFKRYQIQPVWRADRPQKGRYREFYQCDADVVGSNSLLNEVELVNIYASVFEKLGIDVEIRINNRKILAGIAESIGYPDELVSIVTILDKLDKVGVDKVEEELHSKFNLNDDDNNILDELIRIEQDKGKYENSDRVSRLAFWWKQLEGGKKHSAIGVKGLDEIQDLLKKTESIKNIIFDPNLARGLNYYTGTIFEVKAKNVQMGSIGGGGRYDDLTGLFGVPNIPGVGVSFGLDRIYDVMEELKLFPEGVQTGTQVLFFNLGEAESSKAFELMQQLRSNSVRCELYHEQAKFDKQFRYADKKNIPYVVIIGSKELEENSCVIKNLKTGEQKSIEMGSILQTSHWLKPMT